MRAILPALAVTACLALAGCGDGAPKRGDELVVFSEPDVVTANGTGGAAEVPKAGTRGHIAGVVVDEAIRPILNATVSIPGLDFAQKSRRDGAFAFADLRPGPYFLTANATGYYPAQAEVDVKEDEFVRVKFVLRAIPPPDPVHRTEKFEGYSEVSDDALLGFGGALCSACRFEFYAGGPGFGGVTLEAVGDAESVSGFRHSLAGTECCGAYESGTATNPMHRIVNATVLPTDESRYVLDVSPESFPVPQQAIAFEVFVTSWYNQEPPTDWSFVEGDP